MPKGSKGFQKWWTEARVQSALQICALYERGQGAAAVAKFNEIEGANVTEGKMKFALWRATGETPKALWKPRKVERAAAAREEAGDIPVDDSEFDAIPQRVRAPGDPTWNAVMPEDQRLKGNSTRLDGAGKVDQRWVKTERATGADIPTIDPVPEGHIVRGVSTMLDSQGDARVQWVKAKKEDRDFWEQWVKATERHVELYRGLAEPTPMPMSTQEDLLNVFPLGDPHVGMLAWAPETGTDFDVKIAEQELVRCVDTLVDRAPAADVGVLANMGDYFHAESDDQLTPHGKNKLDVDTRWAKVMDAGFLIKRRLIDAMLRKHRRVISIDVPGNHDPRMARMLTAWTKAIYSNEPRVEVLSNTNPFIYLRHGRSLLGFAHGDGAKVPQLPGIMGRDVRADFGETWFHHWFTGHLHQQKIFEIEDCIIEVMRTLSPRDYWAHWKGYRSGQSLDCVTFSKLWGVEGRQTVPIQLVKALNGELLQEFRAKLTG